MADGNRRGDSRNTGCAEVARRDAAAEKAGIEAIGQAGKAAGSALRDSGETTETVSRHGREVVAEVARDAVEAARQAAEAQAEAAQRGGEAGAEIVRRVGEAARDGTGAVAEAGQASTRAMRSGAEEMWRLMPRPDAAAGGMPDMQKAFAGFVGDMIRANLQIGQELFRLANPGAVIEMQQRLMRGYLDAIVSGQAMLLGAAQRTAGTPDAPDPQRR